jgi:hypothetical protein
MTWFKVDDTLGSHPKARAAGLAAMGLWVVAGAWSSQHLTEGFVPDWFVNSWPSGQKRAANLVQSGLWIEADSGFTFHQWEERNPSKEQVEAERAAARERQRKHRESKRDADVSHGVTNGVTNGTPTRPDPTSSSFGTTNVDRPDVERLCQHLSDRIVDNGTPRPEISKRWRDAARLMLDKEGRTEEQVHAAIDWCQSDGFWKANILSMPKLREKYDQLRLAAQRNTFPQAQDSKAGLFERAMQRAQQQRLEIVQ